MTEKTTIFGFGSLINEYSLHSTVPNVETVKPVILKNYIRVFETEAKNRITPNHVPACALNIREDTTRSVNGVSFDVTQEYLDSLLERENGYILKEVSVECFSTGKAQKAFAFLAEERMNHGHFLFDEPMQLQYLELCIDGSKQFGRDFYKMFLETTLINDKKLTEIDEIRHLI